MDIDNSSDSAFAQDDNEKSELTNAVAAVDSDYRYAYDVDDIGNRETSSERGTNSVYTANSLKGIVSSSLSTTLSCDEDKCVLTSSFGGLDANVGLEFTYKRKTVSWDIRRFHREGFVLSETEFESPLRAWME